MPKITPSAKPTREPTIIGMLLTVAVNVNNKQMMIARDNTLEMVIMYGIHLRANVSATNKLLSLAEPPKECTTNGTTKAVVVSVISPLVPTIAQTPLDTNIGSIKAIVHARAIKRPMPIVPPNTTETLCTVGTAQDANVNVTSLLILALIAPPKDLIINGRYWPADVPVFLLVKMLTLLILLVEIMLAPTMFGNLRLVIVSVLQKPMHNAK